MYSSYIPYTIQVVLPARQQHHGPHTAVGGSPKASSTQHGSICELKLQLPACSAAHVGSPKVSWQEVCSQTPGPPWLIMIADGYTRVVLGSTRNVPGSPVPLRPISRTAEPCRSSFRILRSVRLSLTQQQLRRRIRRGAAHSMQHTALTFAPHDINSGGR